MTKRTAITGIFMSTVMLFSLSQAAFAQEASSIPPATTGIKAFSADLTGDAEVPGPGADGEGQSFVVVNPNARRICYSLSVAGITPPTAAHIHEGAAGVSGGPVVPFDLSGQGYSGCVTNVDEAVVERVAEDPAGFYVNVHNDDFPQGALRGQLRD